MDEINSEILFFNTSASFDASQSSLPASFAAALEIHQRRCKYKCMTLKKKKQIYPNIRLDPTITIANPTASIIVGLGIRIFSRSFRSGSAET
jgi:hypothetical protein